MTDYQSFKKKRLMVRIISSLLLTGFVVYIALQKNLQTWHWIAIVAVLALILVAGRGFSDFCARWDLPWTSSILAARSFM